MKKIFSELAEPTIDPHLSFYSNSHVHVGNVYIADFFNYRSRKVTVSTGIITTFAGTGSADYSGDGGAAMSAALYGPFGVALDSSGTIITI